MIDPFAPRLLYIRGLCDMGVARVLCTKSVEEEEERNEEPAIVVCLFNTQKKKHGQIQALSHTPSRFYHLQ